MFKVINCIWYVISEHGHIFTDKLRMTEDNDMKKMLWKICSKYRLEINYSCNMVSDPVEMYILQLAYKYNGFIFLKM